MGGIGGNAEMELKETKELLDLITLLSGTIERRIVFKCKTWRNQEPCVIEQCKGCSGSYKCQQYLTAKRADELLKNFSVEISEEHF